MATKSGKNTGQGVRWPSPIFSFSPFRSRSELLFAILEARRLDRVDVCKVFWDPNWGRNYDDGGGN